MISFVFTIVSIIIKCDYFTIVLWCNMVGSSTGRKKDSINATVSPSIKRKVIALVESGEYSSMSDVVVQALNMLFSDNRSNQNAPVPSETTSDQFEREIWKQKGVVYQKMGKLKEAIECYDKALGIDTKRMKLVEDNTSGEEFNPAEFTRRVVIE